MQLRYSFRLYPDVPQREALARAFGCARVVFNDALAARQAARAAGEPYVPDAELSKRLTEAKKDPVRTWLGEISAVVLQQALGDLNAAYRNFLASATGKRKGPKMRPPRFRSRKDSRQAVRFTANSRFRVLENGKLRAWPLRRAGRRDEDHRASVPAPGAEEAPQGAEVPVPQAEGQHEQGEGPRAGGAGARARQ